MNQHDRIHAMAYADNLTRIHMLHRFRKKYPGLFSHAILSKRPADPDKDYYSPPSISDKCVVVESLTWSQAGCKLVACFPYKNYDEPCMRGTDRMQWVRLDDSRHVLACQPSCSRGMILDTTYRQGDCFVSNAAKKLFVMYPERYNGSVAKHARLTLDEKSGRLAINAAYCKAYGLKFDPDLKDCRLPTGQYVLELFIGSTVFRRKLIKSNYLPPEKPPSPPPGLPKLTEFYERSWEETATVDDEDVLDPDKTASVDPTIALEKDLVEENDVAIEELVQWLSAELAAEYGVHAVTRQVRHYLTRKLTSKLASQVLADRGLRYALLHGTLKTAAARTTSTAAALGTRSSVLGVKSAFSLGSLALGIYGVVSLLTDVFDPYEYGKVLNRDQIDQIDRTLDVRYFGTERFRDIRLSPEDVWDILADERDTEVELRRFKRHFDEYMDALHHYRPETLRELELVVEAAATTKKRLSTESNGESRSRKLSTWQLWTAVVLIWAVTAYGGIPYVDYFAVFACVLFLIWNHRW